jgi:hypothetical protein
MTPELHLWVGLTVLLANLVVGLWALVRYRAGQNPGRALSIAGWIAGDLFVFQVSLGADLFARGARPAVSPWGEIHLILPILALAHFLFFAFRRKAGVARTRQWATTLLTIAVVSVVNYAIGLMGNMPAQPAVERIPGTASRSAIDSIAVGPEVHVALGSAVLVITLLCAGWLGWLALKGRPTGRAGTTLLLLSQVLLMAQAVIGIKLLSQGLGVLQIFIHYLGGLAPILFFLLTYWFPARNPKAQTRNQAIAALFSFVFVLMTFTIGRMYVQGGL